MKAIRSRRELQPVAEGVDLPDPEEGRGSAGDSQL